MKPGTASRVLVVDDEENIRTVLRRYLEAEGLAVAEAPDGDRALARPREAATYVVLLDVKGPDRTTSALCCEAGGSGPH